MKVLLTFLKHKQILVPEYQFIFRRLSSNKPQGLHLAPATRPRVPTALPRQRLPPNRLTRAAAASPLAPSFRLPRRPRRRPDRRGSKPPTPSVAVPPAACPSTSRRAMRLGRARFRPSGTRFKVYIF
jgi:hypothetical protein